MKPILRPILFTVAVISLSGTPAVASDVKINTVCPVMPEVEADPSITVTYQGKTVAFCCERCKARFLADPSPYLALLPQFAAAPASPAVEEAAEADGIAGDPVRKPLIGRLHPVIVHFPLAGIPLALLGLLAWVYSGREAFARADVIPLFVGTSAAIAAVISGNVAEDAMQFGEASRAVVERHESLSTVVMVICVVATILRGWQWKLTATAWRWAYGLLLFVATAMLAVTGYLGGSLVFGPDHLRL